VLGASSKVLVDQKAGNNLLFLPLDKLVQQSAAAAVIPEISTTTPRVTPAPETAPALDAARSRDGLRTRER